MPMRFLYFCSLLLLAQTLLGQEGEKVSDRPFFTGIDLSVDVLKLTSLATPFEQKYEGGVKFVFFDLLGVAFDYGYGKLEPERAIKNGEYTSEGTYFRAGMDFRAAIDAKNSIYFGMRYGQSSFEDRGNYTIIGQIEEDLFVTFDRRNLQADWFEVILGTESEVMPKFYVGTIFRLRILGSYDTFEPIDVYAIPGYGRTFDNTIPAANVYVKYRLSF